MNDRPPPRIRAQARLPIEVGGRRVLATMLSFDGPPTEAPWVRLHSACLTGDAFGSLRCDCGAQLNAALAQFAAQGGTLLYLQQEGRGIGLQAKVEAYALQDAGLGTYEANHRLGLPDDARDYRDAATMLQLLGLARVRLLGANPRKRRALAEAGIRVDEARGLEGPVHEDNRRYLADKARWFAAAGRVGA